MNIINNRYKIIKKLKENERISSYLVEDLFEGNKKLELYMFDRFIFPEERYEFIKHYFLLINSFSSIFFLKNLSFSTVQTIDGIKKDGSFLFCCVEFVEGLVPLYDWLKKKGIREVVLVSGVILRAINFVGLRSLEYSSFRINDLFVKEFETSYRLLHRDLLQDEIEASYTRKHQTGFDKRGFLEDNLKWNVDTVQLAYMFLSILEGLKETKQTDFAERVQAIRKKIDAKDENTELYERYLIFIEKLFNGYWNTSFEMFYKIFADYATEFGILPEIETSETSKLLTSNGVLIGRHKEVKKVFELANRQSVGNSSSVILVSGEKGAGKTRLLKEIIYLFNFENVLTVSSFRASKDNPNAVLDDFFKAYADLLMSFYFGEKRKEYLNKLEKINTRFAIGLNHERGHQEFKMILQATNLIFNSLNKQKIVFLIDNLEFINDTSLDFILYLLTDNMIKDKITFVLSVNYQNIVYNSKIRRFINILSSIGVLDEMELRNFDLRNVKLMAKSILLMQNLEEDFIRHVYTETSGNPLLISNMLRKYVLNEYITINRYTGRWEFCREKLEEDKANQVPQEATTVEHFKASSVEEEYFLLVLSCFYEPTSIERLAEISALSTRKSLEIAQKYVALGVVEVYLEGMDQFITISNPANRSVIYEEIRYPIRQSIHETILQNLNLKSDVDVMEAIMQYRALGRSREGREHIFQLAESRKRNNPQSAINLLKKTLEFRDEDTTMEMKIRLSLSNIYYSVGLFEEGLEVLNQMVDCFESVPETALKEMYLFRRANLALTQGKRDILMECRRMLKKMSRKERTDLAIIIYMKMQGDSYVLQNKIREAMAIYKGIIEKCDGKIELNPVLAEVYRVYAKISNHLLEGEKRLYYFEKCCSLFEEQGDTFSYLLTKGNIGYLYLLEYYDLEKALDICIKTLEEAQRGMYVIIEIFLLNNIGFIYMLQGHYTKSIEYFKMAFWRSEILGVNFHKAEILAELLRCFIKAGQFEESLNFRQENIDFINMQDETQESYKFKALAADLAFAVNDYEKTLSEIKALIELPYKLPKNYREEWQYLYQINEAILQNVYPAEIMQLYLEHLSRCGTDFEYQDSYYRFCRYLMVSLQHFGQEKVMPIIEKLPRLQVLVRVERTLLHFAYFQTLLPEKSDAQRLQELLRISAITKAYPWESIGIRINTEIAELLYQEDKPEEALLYMAESLFRTVKIVSNVPAESRERFFNSRRLVDVFYFFEQYTNKDVLEWTVSNKEFDLAEINQYLKKYSESFFVRGSKMIDSIIAKKMELRGLSESLAKVAQEISLNRKENISHFLEYFSTNILATEAYVLMNDNYDKYEIFVDFKTGTSRIDPILLIKSFSREKITYFSGTGCVKEYPEINGLLAVPIFNRQLDRNTKNHGFIVFVSDSGVHLFDEMQSSENKMGVSFLMTLIEGYDLKQSISIDSLTGALTRKYLFDNLNHWYHFANKEYPVCIAMFDLDHFKRVNDTYGHQVGDLVLKTVVQTVQKNLAPEHSIGRYGGEEFVVIFAGLTESEVLEICEGLRNELEAIRFEDYPDLTITMSVGIKPLDREDDNSVEDWIEKADRALYYSKDTGRNRCSIYHEFFEERMEEVDLLYGMISGDELRDGRVLFALTELTLMKRRNRLWRDNIQEILTYAMELLGVKESGILCYLPDGEEVGLYKMFGESKLYRGSLLDEQLAEKVRKKEKHIRTVDWNDLSDRVEGTDFPLWKSVMAVRVLSEGEVRGILYFRTPMIERTFDDRDLNFANIIANVAGMYLNREEIYEEYQ